MMRPRHVGLELEHLDLQVGEKAVIKFILKRHLQVET